MININVNAENSEELLLGVDEKSKKECEAFLDKKMDVFVEMITKQKKEVADLAKEHNKFEEDNKGDDILIAKHMEQAQTVMENMAKNLSSEMSVYYPTTIIPELEAIFMNNEAYDITSACWCYSESKKFFHNINEQIKPDDKDIKKDILEALVRSLS